MSPYFLSRDEAFSVVFNLRTRNGLDETVGTGTFVATGQASYMVTASHVARTCNATTSVVISDASGLATAIPLSTFNPAVEWRHHPTADLAVMQVIPEATRAHIERRCFPLARVHKSKIAPSRDTELTSVGFPSGLGAKGRFSPLTFRSFSSSSVITFNRFDTRTECDFFVLENPGMGGYSGCPVLDLGVRHIGSMSAYGNGTTCWGFMHGTIGDATGGKLAAVTLASYLHELIQTPPAVFTPAIPTFTYSFAPLGPRPGN